MKSTGIIRHIDDIGCIRRILKIADGCPMEIYYDRDGSITLKPYRKSFEECAIDWFDSHIPEMNACIFRHEGSYTFCIVNPEGLNRHMPTRAGHAKRFKDDAWDLRIGKVAAFANAMGRDLNKMIGYEE